MKLIFFCFTQKAKSLCENLYHQCSSLGHECIGYIPEKFAENTPLLPLQASLQDTVSKIFPFADGIIFISACGIAVRSIAPSIKSKTTDPAVVVIDELGQYAISLLSGHIGGANQLTHMLAKMIQATPIISTATDLQQKFSVDCFAAKQNLAITDMSAAKFVSSELLQDHLVALETDFPIKGPLPKQLYLYKKNTEHSFHTLSSTKTTVGIYIGFDEDKKNFTHTLCLLPKIIFLGIGCKRNTPLSSIEAAVFSALEEYHISFQSVSCISSIDIKKEEEGLLSFCQKYNLPFLTYSSDALEKVDGNFSQSPFVQTITGVDNVCERAAVLSSQQGTLCMKKTVKDGVTIAAAMKPWYIDFSFSEGDLL